MSKFDDLSKAINLLSDSSTNVHQRLNDRLSDHDIKLERHDAELDFLFVNNGLKRKEPYEK